MVTEENVRHAIQLASDALKNNPAVESRNGMDAGAFTIAVAALAAGILAADAKKAD